ncbi:hypothetical protein GCM10027442_10250 [Emticicia fontis]
MALSFPHNSYGQKRTLNQATAKSVALTETQVLQSSLMASTEKIEEENNQESFIEMCANYVISLFTEKLFHSKSIAIKSFKKSKCDYFAIKQDFDYQVIG